MCFNYLRYHDILCFDIIVWSHLKNLCCKIQIFNLQIMGIQENSSLTGTNLRPPNQLVRSERRQRFEQTIDIVQSEQQIIM